MSTACSRRGREGESVMTSQATYVHTGSHIMASYAYAILNVTFSSRTSYDLKLKLFSEAELTLNQAVQKRHSNTK